MNKRNRKSFNYCKKHIHKLPYYPQANALPCKEAAEKVGQFITQHNIDFILYKGGEIENELCLDLNITAYNMELHFPQIEKVEFHDLKVKVGGYYTQIVNYL